MAKGITNLTSITRESNKLGYIPVGGDLAVRNQLNGSIYSRVVKFSFRCHFGLWQPLLCIKSAKKLQGFFFFLSDGILRFLGHHNENFLYIMAYTESLRKKGS